MMMNEAFYDDQGITKSQAHEVNFLKRPMTLDLNSDSSAKKSKFAPTLLESPDLINFAITTPEVERMLHLPTSLSLINTPTPSLSLINTPSLFAKAVTEEQEKFAEPFSEILNNMHNNNDSNNALQVEIPMTSSGSNSSEYQSEPQYSVLLPSNNFSNIIPHHIIKEEPQTVPTSSSPLMSPINMESQEEIKLQRKRQRNRVAASKCRRRKLERIAKLEDKVKQLKNENSDLTTTLKRLFEQISHLKETVMQHANNGCEFAVNCL